MISIGSEKIVWTPESGETPLYVSGRSHNARIQIGDDSAAQMSRLSMASALYLGDSSSVTFIVKVGDSASWYHPTFVPKCEVDKNGKVSLVGAGTIGGKNITARHYLSGNADGDCFYIVLEITNNDGSSINVTPALRISDLNLQNFRGDVIGYVGDDDNDTVAFDATNKYLQVTSAEISNIFLGIRACNTYQHYVVGNGWSDGRSDMDGASNDLSDAISGANTTHYFDVQYAESAHPVTIGSGETAKFVWAIGYKTTQVALQTLMASLSANPTTDLDAADACFTTQRASINIGNPTIEMLYSILTGRQVFQAENQKIDSKSTVPAGSNIFTFPFSRDGYYSAKTILQVSEKSSIISDDFSLFRSYENIDHSQEHEIAKYVNGSGVFVASGNNGSPGDQDCYQILKGYEYFVATGDTSWLSNNIAYLNEIANYLISYYNANKGSQNLFPGHGSSTYLDGDGNITGENPMIDPVLVSLVSYTMTRLAELNRIVGDSSTASTLNSFSKILTTNFLDLWNEEKWWLLFNKKVSGTEYDNRHIAKVDACLWGILDTEKSAVMAGQLLTDSEWFNSSNKSFNEVPTSDSLYSADSYWYGKGWNITDFKAIETIVRFGTQSQKRTALGLLFDIAIHRINTVRGMCAEHFNDSGIFGFSVGAIHELLVRGVFGIDSHADYLTINPNSQEINSVKKTIRNLLLGGKSFNITVKGSGDLQTVYLNNVITDNPIYYADCGDINEIRVVFSKARISVAGRNALVQTRIGRR